MSIGKHVYLDNGNIWLECKSIQATTVTCVVLVGGTLGSKKVVNLPETSIDVPALTEKDRADLNFAIEQGIDFIFASYIRTAEAVLEIKNLVKQSGKEIMIISKIQNRQGLQNIEAIIKVSDGILIDRCCLGTEASMEKVFLIQKSVIARCNLAGKPVICAGQILETLATKTRPTRAESSDVGNAIVDGADCIMLCQSTETGNTPYYPIMVAASICREAENVIWQRNLFLELCNKVSKIHLFSQFLKILHLFW